MFHDILIERTPTATCKGETHEIVLDFAMALPNLIYHEVKEGQESKTVQGKDALKARFKEVQAMSKDQRLNGGLGALSLLSVWQNFLDSSQDQPVKQWVKDALENSKRPLKRKNSGEETQGVVARAAKKQKTIVDVRRAAKSLFM